MSFRFFLVGLILVQAYMVSAQYDDETHVNITEFYDRAATTGCGNGIVERNRGEKCDEGTANGNYGRCCTTSCQPATFDWTPLKTLSYQPLVVGCDSTAVHAFGAAKYMYARSFFPKLTLYQFDIDRITFITSCSGRLWYNSGRFFFGTIDHEEDCWIDNFDLRTVCDVATPHVIERLYIHRRTCTA